LAATVELTEETIKSIKKITWAWTAHTDGIVAKTTPNAVTTIPYTGEIIKLVTVPGAGGDAPDPDYDVYIYDDDDVDLLMGQGMNKHTSNTEQVLAPILGVVAYDKLTLYVSGAGSGNKGTVHLYIR